MDHAITPQSVIATPHLVSPADVRDCLQSDMRRAQEAQASPLLLVASLEGADPQVHLSAATDTHLRAWTKSAPVCVIKQAIASRLLVAAAVSRGMGVAADVFDTAIATLNVPIDISDDMQDPRPYRASSLALAEQIGEAARLGWRTDAGGTPPTPTDADRQHLADVLVRHGNEHPDLYRHALSTRAS